MTLAGFFGGEVPPESDSQRQRTGVNEADVRASPLPFLIRFTRRNGLKTLATEIDNYLMDLRRRNASPHTIAAYTSDLRQFLNSLPSGLMPADVTLPILREWLTGLYDRHLSALTRKRKLAAVRSLFDFLLQEGVIPANVARLILTPKIPSKLPAVMTVGQVEALMEGAARLPVDRNKDPADSTR